MKEITTEGMPKLPEKLEQKEVASEFKFISLRRDEKVRGEIQIKGKVKNAISVEFYCQLVGALSPIYLGRAQSKDKNLWEYSWNTNLTPNGEYQLFAKITNEYGEYESERLKIKIENEIPKEPEKEEKLKKEHQEIKEEIEEIDKKVEEKKERISQEISKKAKPGVVKEEAKGKVEELAEKIRETRQAEEEIKKSKEKKRAQEEKLKELEKELGTLEKIPEPKLEAEIIKKEKEARLEVEKTEFQKTKERIETSKEELKKKTEGKEEIKKEIIEKVKPEEKEEISNRLKLLEKEIKEKEEIKIKKEEVLVKDSDGDDLSDEFELLIKTNPFNPDSDGDGFLDNIEYKLGYDPLEIGPADKIVYSDAKKAKPKKADIYYVERVSAILLPTDQWGIKIEGKGLPNSFVTIYIYSSPIVMVTKTDGNGNWNIVLDRPLADGAHEVYATVTNNHGGIEDRSEPFIFEKSGKRIVAITVSGLLTEKAVSPVHIYQFNFLILTISLIILAIGIALVIIGISAQRRLKEKESKFS